jgi:hypothetical protein
MEDFEIYLGTANYGQKDNNPVDSVKFYKKPNYNGNGFNPESFSLKKEEVSSVLPERFSDTMLRLYVKNNDVVRL